ncbi:PREDICTED: double-strand break repair protein MRE11 [Habropoda laboriosa]|uniref:double-strand break repair protein MRE11 n=1 Tax=Habropoda laboriosa TaxID=597456 RepID=UPI00083DDAC1|nr:PREDICTED: double-strand break repair protein MRE11 [Habropoda laboriosa]
MSSKQGSNEKYNPDDIIKILVATDIHLGFEHNKKGGQKIEDSFTTFEEILQYGKENEVDFVLLGGDLFHDTKPSQTAMIKCMELLRKYCLGPREVKIQFLSDPEVIFRHCMYKTVNYEDPNLNVSMPVFSIHGNHDDPSFGAIGSMDLLSVSGLINYFGKWTNLCQVTIPPLIIKKGETHIALYGLSYISDQRLARLLRDYKVNMLCPKEIPDCFNICVLHQNRAKHGDYAYIPENKLPNFLNFVIWGHEHECRITPEYISDTEYFISQPGSSIATSLCEGEAKPKHVGILTICKTNFKMKEVNLKTVRPFVFDNLILQDENIPKNYTESLSASVCNFVDNYIENELIPKAAAQLTNHPKQPIQPLLRLRIFYNSEEEVFDGIKLAQKYCDEVANPMDMIIFRKQKNLNKVSKSNLSNLNDEMDDVEQILSYDDDNRDWNKTVQGGIKKHFSLEENRDKLTVLTVNGLNEALNRFVDRGDIDAFKDVVSHQMKKTIARDKRLEEEDEEQVQIQELFNKSKNRAEKNLESDLRKDSDDNCSDDDEIRSMKPTTKGTRGRGATRGRGSGRGKSKVNEKNPLDVTTTSRQSKVQQAKRQTRKQNENTLQNYMGLSSQTKTKASNMVIISD